ncbi:MAG: hypothetical protein LJE89_17140, partial [Deltaproteobacteria bacterium]|nr:hypothetical protein [Deltaproteobacteria bacterium]
VHPDPSACLSADSLKYRNSFHRLLAFIKKRKLINDELSIIRRLKDRCGWKKLFTFYQDFL